MPPKAAAKKAAAKKAKGGGKGKKGKSKARPVDDEEFDDDGGALDELTKNAGLDDLLPPPPVDSDEEDPDKVQPATAKLFMIPRDHRQIMEIEVAEGVKDAKIKNLYRDLGNWTNGKYVHCARARTKPHFYCVPYAMEQVLELDPITSKCRDIGEKLATGISEHKYTSCVVCSNWHGKMYAAPCRANRVLEIDPDAGTAQEIGPIWGRKDLQESLYYAIGLSPSGSGTGKIYAIPYDARRVLEIDPSRHGASREIGPDLGSLRGKYKCVTLGPIGDLYAAPLNAPKVLRISRTGEVTVVGPDFGKLERKFACIVTAPNKLMYAPPLYAERVIEINPNKGDTREIGPKLGPEAKYASACVAPVNNRIYCPPLEARAVLEINCEYHEVAEIGVDIGVGEEKYSSIAAAPIGGKLYAAPREARYVLEIDPGMQLVREIGKDMGSCKRKFTCIVPGLTHKEILDAGKTAVYNASKALERALRWQAHSKRELDKAQYAFGEAQRKLERGAPLAAEAEVEAEQAAEEEVEAEKHKTEGMTEASYWIQCREAANEAAQRARNWKDRLKRYTDDFELQTRNLAREQERYEDRSKTVVECQLVLDKAEAEAEDARSKEVEARRQASEVEEEKKENARKYG